MKMCNICKQNVLFSNHKTKHFKAFHPYKPSQWVLSKDFIFLVGEESWWALLHWKQEFCNLGFPPKEHDIQGETLQVQIKVSELSNSANRAKSSWSWLIAQNCFSIHALVQIIFCWLHFDFLSIFQGRGCLVYQNSLIDGRRCYILFRIGRSLNVGQCWDSDELLLRGEDIEWNCLFMYFREMKSDYPTKSGFFTYGWAVIDLAVKFNRRCGWYDSLIAWPLLRRTVFSLISHEVKCSLGLFRFSLLFLKNWINNLVKEQNRL